MFRWKKNNIQKESETKIFHRLHRLKSLCLQLYIKVVNWINYLI